MCLRSRMRQIVRCCCGTRLQSVFVLSSLLFQLALQHRLPAAQAGSITKGFSGLLRMPSAPSVALRNHKAITSSPAGSGSYEIRSVSGEPNYKSVNLTWEVEFVPTTAATRLHNSSTTSIEVDPPRSFQIYFCELQSFGPHRCRSKSVDNNNDSSELATQEEGSNRQVRQFSAVIDNLRMATKYSFHIRPQVRRRSMRLSGRAELFDNEIDGAGETIIIPTKGFAAQATQCLPHASEIEVETGPYFGGKIVVDGGNCGIKGDPNDPKDKYTMRIDHEQCGSLVKPETSTVETFITVQENLGIFTHSTRRFVVVCSFQSGMQTVRASFTVPGKDGVAAPVENDPFEPDDRVGREQRHMRFVDKSHLVLKEPSVEAAESAALVTEIHDPVGVPADSDVPKSMALLEQIVPGLNEQHIKQRNVAKAEPLQVSATDMGTAQYAKLTVERTEHMEHSSAKSGRPEEDSRRGFDPTLHMLSTNLGSVLLVASLAILMMGALIFVASRELRRQQGRQGRAAKSVSAQFQHKHLRQKTLPRSLQANYQGTM